MSDRSRTRRTIRWCRRHPRAVGVGVAVLAVVAVVGAVTGPPTDDSTTAADGTPTTSTDGSVTPAAPGSSVNPGAGRLSATPADRDQRSDRLATAVLATVAVKGRAPMTGYRRDLFGSAWTDDNDNPLGHNGCDTRNDILRRDLGRVVLTAGSSGCAVLTGVLRDPYTDTSITFRRGPSTSGEVQIDHVVALGDAWQKGAQRYTERTRTALANDPLNLLAVDASTNAAKGDSDAATWLPPNTAYRCSYVARQIAVKARYELWMTRAEHDAAARVLGSCPQQTVPAEPGTVALQRATPSPTTPPSDVRYPNCAAVRAAGAAPIHAGDPGYDRTLDRDGDGVACE